MLALRTTVVASRAVPAGEVLPGRFHWEVEAKSVFDRRRLKEI
jgi:hypothetical protein